METRRLLFQLISSGGEWVVSWWGLVEMIDQLIFPCPFCSLSFTPSLGFTLLRCGYLQDSRPILGFFPTSFPASVVLECLTLDELETDVTKRHGWSLGEPCPCTVDSPLLAPHATSFRKHLSMSPALASIPFSSWSGNTDSQSLRQFY